MDHTSLPKYLCFLRVEVLLPLVPNLSEFDVNMNLSKLKGKGIKLPYLNIFESRGEKVSGQMFVKQSERPYPNIKLRF